MSRYQGNPFLRLLECYVMWAIGELPEDLAQQLDVVAPKLREVYGHDGSWQDVIAAEMRFPEDLPVHIWRFWDEYRELRNRDSVESSVEEFACKFVDENFVDR